MSSLSSLTQFTAEWNGILPRYWQELSNVDTPMQLLNGQDIQIHNCIASGFKHAIIHCLFS